MLQIRKRNGDVTVVDSSVAVEFVDSTGKLAAAITQSSDGTVTILTPGDPVLNGYARVNNLALSKVSVHEPFTSRKVSI